MKKRYDLRDKRNWLSTKQAGELLGGISSQTIRRYIKEGFLSAVELPTGQLRLKRADVEAMASGLRRV